MCLYIWVCNRWTSYTKCVSSFRGDMFSLHILSFKSPRNYFIKSWKSSLCKHNEWYWGLTVAYLLKYILVSIYYWYACFLFSWLCTDFLISSICFWWLNSNNRLAYSVLHFYYYMFSNFVLTTNVVILS